MTSASPYPREGAKLLLERERVSDDGERAEYRAYVYTPDARYDMDAALAMEGRATLSPRGDRPQPSHENALENIAKSVARAAARKRDDGLPPWPRCIGRWRR